MPVTLTDVAQVAGVSIATASRALSESNHPVSTETRRHILRVADELGYHPNLIARSLRTDRTFTLGVILENVAEFFSSLILRGILDYFSGSAYSIIILNTYYDKQMEIDAVKILQHRSTDGIIFIDTAMHAAEEFTSHHTIPCVFVNRRYQVAQEPSIIPDNRQNARKATAHLAELGHRRIAYIGGPKGWEATRERYNGYCDVLKERGIPYQSTYIAHGDWQLSSGYDAAQELMHLADPPTAIFATSDRMALGAIYAVYDFGGQVPDDVAVVGFDNRNFTSIVRPAVTTVSLPGYEMGQKAAQLLLHQLEGRDMPRGIMPVCGQLIIRESCGAFISR